MKKFVVYLLSILLAGLLIGFNVACSPKAGSGENKHILFLTGANSHGWGAHKHIAGTILLAEALPQGAPNVTTEGIHTWPTATQLEKADALVIYADGWAKHPANNHLDDLKTFMDAGKGLVVLHWATGIGTQPVAGSDGPQDPNRDPSLNHMDDPNRVAWRKLVGADFEAFYSISNFYTSEFKDPAKHPVMNGVTPFNLYDECYYHLREGGTVDRVLPLHPPASTIQPGFTPYRGNDHARAAIAKGEEQYCAWTFERPEGGRAFGFTGGHFHWSWAKDEVRKMVMNACLWAAGGEVPEGGIDTPKPDAAQMLENMDVPNPGWTVETLQAALDLSQAGVPIPWGRYSRSELMLPVKLFDGETLDGWTIREGEEKWWRVRDGVIEGGSMEENVPHNTFITIPKNYQNFELELKMRLIAGEGKGFKNSGIQVRSQRLPNHHEMIGYQVDGGIGWWGKLYDESRRRSVIAEPVDAEGIKEKVHDWDEWNHYQIICDGPHIRSWINGVPAIQYTEEDPEIPLEGLFGVQAHSGGKFVVQFKDIIIRELPPTEGAKTWEGVELKAWPKKQ